MNIVSSWANFFLSEWLWSITTDWYHIPISIFFMCVAFRWLLRMAIIPAVFITFCAHLYSFAIFSLCVHGVLVHLFNFAYEPAAHMVLSQFYACLYLGFIYALLQISFFALINIWYPLKWISMSVVAICCNVAVSALTFYLLGDSLM